VSRKPVIVLLVGLGALLIILSARGTLWFDELLSLQWARSAENPWQIWEVFRHDNNHPLNSLWLWLVGEDRFPLIYRLLSMVSGVCTLVLIWMAARRLAKTFAWVPLLLASTSFPLVLYASEARGYAPALACLLGAWLVVSTRTESGLAWRVPLFWLLCLGAMFSHGTSLVILAALGVYFLVDRQTKGGHWLQTFGGAVVWFGVPLVAAALYWFFFLRVMIIAGGPEYTLPTVLAHLFGYALGAPGAGHWVFALVGLLVLVAVLIFARFPDVATRVFFAGAVLIFPALSLVATDTTYLYFRYFLVSLPFVYLLSAPLAARMDLWPRGWRILAATVLGAVVLGQLPRLVQLISVGRGDYVTALRVIVEDCSLDKTIVANNEMQVGFVLGYGKKLHSELAPLVLVPQARAAEQPTEWIVYVTQDDPPASPEPLINLHDTSYRFVSFHRSAPVSGAHWTIYRRIGCGKINPAKAGGEERQTTDGGR
jgi:hypothetical protein